MLQIVNTPIIRPLRDANEAHICADFMAASEPWLTLGFDAKQIFQRLMNPQREVHVVEMENRIVGTLVLHLDGLMNGYIQLIAIHPDARNHGLGKRLMQFAEEQIFQQSPNVFLCVSSFNQRAQKFYADLGYQRVGELPGFLVAGHSEILMRKTCGPWLTFSSPK